MTSFHRYFYVSVYIAKTSIGKLFYFSMDLINSYNIFIKILLNNNSYNI